MDDVETLLRSAADALEDTRRRVDALEYQVWIYRNLLALMPYTLPAPWRTIPHQRPPHADKVPLFPRRVKAGGHL